MPPAPSALRHSSIRSPPWLLRHHQTALLDHEPPVGTHRRVGQEKPLMIARPVWSARLRVVAHADPDDARAVSVVRDRRKAGQHGQLGVDANVELAESISVAPVSLPHRFEPGAMVLAGESHNTVLFELNPHA